MSPSSFPGEVERIGAASELTGRTAVAEATLPSGVRAVAVLLRDEPTDAGFLDRAVSVAQIQNSRLLVVVAPQISRWLVAFAMLPGLAIPEWTSFEEQEADAIKRCSQLALSRVPADLPTTIQAVLRAETKFLGELTTGFGDQLTIVGHLAARRWPLRRRSIDLDPRAPITVPASGVSAP